MKCRKQCKLDAAKVYCLGCGRTLEEIKLKGINAMTPCEEMGWKVGDSFTVVEDLSGFTEGQVVTLSRDDGTRRPCFIGENSRYTCTGDDGLTEPGSFLHLSDVIKIDVTPEMRRVSFYVEYTELIPQDEIEGGLASIDDLQQLVQYMLLESRLDNISGKVLSVLEEVVQDED